MTFYVRLGATSDLPFLLEHERHVRPDVLEAVVHQGQTLVAERDNERVGWLRWNLFWEDRMAQAGFTSVMTSTAANESAQHLYRRLGYLDCGSLLLPGDPTEILFRKDLLE